MKITGQPNDPSAVIAQTGTSAAAKVGQEAAAAAAKQERKASGVGVTVSSSARTLAQTSSDAPEVDLEKVDAMREAIAQKTFVVNPEAIAEKMLANAREMLTRLH